MYTGFLSEGGVHNRRGPAEPPAAVARKTEMRDVFILRGASVAAPRLDIDVQMNTSRERGFGESAGPRSVAGLR
jgi:hypothetical protein